MHCITNILIRPENISGLKSLPASITSNYFVFGGKDGKPAKEKLSRDLFTNGYKLIKDKLGPNSKYT
ncbi:MAG: hypothetical protein ABFD10_15010, partial [Prolixibacteraceae bacterium]